MGGWVCFKSEWNTSYILQREVVEAFWMLAIVLERYHSMGMKIYK